MRTRKFWIAAALLLGTVAAAFAVQPIVSSNGSITITTGNTYQVLQLSRQNYNSLTIQNNNTNTDNCWLEVTGLVQPGNTTASVVVTPGGVSLTAQQASMQLSPGGSYQRYYPYLPRNQIVITCTTSGDSVYVDTQ